MTQTNMGFKWNTANLAFSVPRQPVVKPFMYVKPDGRIPYGAATDSFDNEDQ